LVFVLSQGILESHLGTKGLAYQTNSVWNVGTYDNGIILYQYKTADESIEPYLDLLSRKYLIEITSKGDTIQKSLNSLIQDSGYINYHGKRFASATRYENSLRKLMLKIKLETKISFYQSIIKMDNEQFLYSFLPNKTKINI